MHTNQNYFFKSQETLISMESESEPFYEDPEFIRRQLTSTKPHSSNKPPAVLPKPKQKNTAIFKANTSQVTLHPDFGQISNQKKWNSTKSVYPNNDHSHFTGTGRKPSHLGASVPNINAMSVHEAIRNDRRKRNEEYLSESHTASLSFQNNHHKEYSCCHCCCFLLVYVLIAGGLLLFFLHVYYPQILDPNHIKESAIIDNIKKEYSNIRKLLRAYCTDYVKVGNQTFTEFIKMCKQKFDKDE